MVRSTLATRLKVGEPRIEISLVQQTEFETASAALSKAHEAAEAIEHLPHGRRCQARPEAALGLVQASVEIFLGCQNLHWIGKLREIDSAMAPSGVLPEHGRRDIPVIVAETRERCEWDAAANLPALSARPHHHVHIEILPVRSWCWLVQASSSYRRCLRR